MLPGHLGKGLSQQRKWIITAFTLNKDKNKMRYNFEHGRRDRRKLYLRFTFLPPPSFGFFKVGTLQKSANLKGQKLPFLEFALKYRKAESIKNIQIKGQLKQPPGIGRMLAPGHFPIAYLPLLPLLDIRQQPSRPPGQKTSALFRKFTIRFVPSHRKEDCLPSFN